MLYLILNFNIFNFDKWSAKHIVKLVRKRTKFTGYIILVVNIFLIKRIYFNIVSLKCIS